MIPAPSDHVGVNKAGSNGETLEKSCLIDPENDPKNENIPSPAPRSQVEFDLRVTGTNINSEYRIALRFKGEQFFESFNLGRYDTMNREQIAFLHRIRDMYPGVSAAISAPPPAPNLDGEIAAAIALGAAVLTKISDPALREIAIRNALTAATQTANPSTAPAQNQEGAS